MSQKSKPGVRVDGGTIEVKSKFDSEFRRFCVSRQLSAKFDDFQNTLETLHKLQKIPFLITYTDPKDGDLLPINNDDNFSRALSTARPLLRVMVQKKGESYGEVNGYGTLVKRRNPIARILREEQRGKPHVAIGLPEDFRRVSAIIDVDIIPETHRRVKLMKNGTDKPLGFYIRDGTSVRVTPHGLEKVPGIFISRLVPGGLAESTGLLAVNDEVLEVNGIEVTGKTLDQVTDMMVANSANLIITVKPVNQRNNINNRPGGSGRSQNSKASLQSGHSTYSRHSNDSDEVRSFPDDDDDVVHEHLPSPNPDKSEEAGSALSQTSNHTDSSTTSSATKDTNLTNDTNNKVAADSKATENEADSPVKPDQDNTPIVTL